MKDYIVKVFNTEKEVDEYMQDRSSNGICIMSNKKLINVLSTEEYQNKFYYMENKIVKEIEEYKKTREQLIDQLIKRLLQLIEEEQVFKLAELINSDNIFTYQNSHNMYKSEILYGWVNLTNTTKLKERLIESSDARVKVFVDELKDDITKIKNRFVDIKDLEHLSFIVDSI
jgi:hypothetical protein